MASGEDFPAGLWTKSPFRGEPGILGNKVFRPTRCGMEWRGDGPRDRGTRPWRTTVIANRPLPPPGWLRAPQPTLSFSPCTSFCLGHKCQAPAVMGGARLRGARAPNSLSPPAGLSCTCRQRGGGHAGCGACPSPAHTLSVLGCHHEQPRPAAFRQQKSLRSWSWRRQPRSGCPQGCAPAEAAGRTLAGLAQALLPWRVAVRAVCLHHHVGFCPMSVACARLSKEHRSWGLGPTPNPRQSHLEVLGLITSVVKLTHLEMRSHLQERGVRMWA